MRKALYLIIVIIVTTANIAYGSGLVSWEHKYSKKSLWHKYKAFSLSSDGSIFIAVIEKNPPKKNDMNVSKMVIWEINEKGKKVSEIEINSSLLSNWTESPMILEPDIKSLFVTKEGDYILFVTLSEGRPFLVKVSRLGDVLFKKDIMEKGRNVIITKLIQTKDDNFLLIGHENLDSLILKIESSGNIIWEKKRDFGEMDYFVDGIITNDGFVLIGNSRKNNKSFKDDSLLWVGKYDIEGNLIVEKSFSGHYGSIANMNNDFFIVYDKAISGEQNIWMRFFDKNLQEQGIEKNIINFEAKMPTSRFNIKTLINNNFIIGGIKNGKPYLAKIDKNGNNLWNYEGETIHLTTDFDVVVSGSQIYFISTEVSKNEQNKLFQKVNVIKFLMND